MTIGSIFLGVALLVLVGLYVARPLLKAAPHSIAKMTTYQALFVQKEAILVQIRSLDFDYDTGKLNDIDYQRQREEMMVEAEDIFHRLDDIENQDQPLESIGVAAVANSDLESEIEAAIASRRNRPAAKERATTQAQPVTSNGKSKYCPECGQPTDPADKFCANCGHKLLNPQHA